jgi:hypothetical protein
LVAGWSPVIAAVVIIIACYWLVGWLVGYWLVGLVVWLAGCWLSVHINGWLVINIVVCLVG